jgi:hypothetical protein
VAYCNLPIQCRYCLATNHLIKDCRTLQGTQGKALAEGQEASPPQQPGHESDIPAPNIEVVQEEGEVGGANSDAMNSNSARNGDHTIYEAPMPGEVENLDDLNEGTYQL